MGVWLTYKYDRLCIIVKSDDFNSIVNLWVLIMLVLSSSARIVNLQIGTSATINKLILVCTELGKIKTIKI